MQIRSLTAGAVLLGLLTATPARAEWTYKEIVDPMSDVRRGIMAAQGDNASIVIKCDENGDGSLYIHIISTKYLGEGRSPSRTVKYRIDGGVPQEISGYHDKNGVLISQVKPGTAGGKMLEGILSGAKLVLQLTTYDFESYTSVIDVAGARANFAKAAKTCGDTSWALAS